MNKQTAIKKAESLGFTVDEYDSGVHLNLPKNYNGGSYHSGYYPKQAYRPVEVFGGMAKLWEELHNDIEGENKYKQACTANNCECWENGQCMFYELDRIH